MHRRIATVAGVRLLVLVAIAAVMLCIGAAAVSAGTLQVQEWRVTNDLTNHGNPSLADWPSISGNHVVWDTGGGSGSEALYSVLDPMVAPGAGTQPLQGNNEGAWTVSTPCVSASGSVNTYVWALNFGEGSEIDTWRDGSETVNTLVPASSGSPYWPVTSGDWVVWSDKSSGDLLAAPWSDTFIESPTTLYSGGIAYSTDVSQSSSGAVAVWADIADMGGYQGAVSYWQNLDDSESHAALIGPADSTGLEQSDARISGDTVVYEQGLRAGLFWLNDGIWTENLLTGQCTQVVDPTGLPVHPDISGDWVVWESGSLGQTRVYAKNTATGVTGPVSPVDVSAQGPRIDGDLVEWVDGRDKGSTNGTTEIYAAQLSGAVDTTPPETTASGWDQGNHYPGPVTVTLTAIDPAGAAGDAVSGVASTWYLIDDPNLESESWTQYSAPFAFNETGDHTVYFYSVDNDGNTEIPKSAKVYISASAPSIDLPSPDAPAGSAERALYDTQPLSVDPALAEQDSSMMGDSTVRFSVPGATASQVTVRWAKVPGPASLPLPANWGTLAAKQFDAVSQEFTTQIKCTEAGLHAVWIHAETRLGTSDVIRYYYVKYLSSGLQQPVNLDCTSVFNGSSTIPLKVKIFDANGQPVTDILPAPKLTVLALHPGAAGSVVESAVDLTAYVDPDDFKYMGNGVWQLNWSAKKNLAKVIGSWSSATIRFSISFAHSAKTVTSTDVSFTRCKG